MKKLITNQSCTILKDKESWYSNVQALNEPNCDSAFAEYKIIPKTLECVNIFYINSKVNINGIHLEQFSNDKQISRRVKQYLHRQNNQFLHLESCIRKGAHLPIPKNHHLVNLEKSKRENYIVTIKSKSIQFLLKKIK